jgi:hypothetical protein
MWITTALPRVMLALIRKQHMTVVFGTLLFMTVVFVLLIACLT